MIPIRQTRRTFLGNASLVSTALLCGRAADAAEPTPEVTTIRLGYWPGYACLAPQSISEALLRAEGFTDVRFVPPSETDSVVSGAYDFDMESAPWLAAQVDRGKAIAILAGVHVGCFELFAYEPIRTIADLKGKRVGIDYLGSAPHIYLSVMVAQVGLDPASDVDWVADPIEAVATAETGSMQRFVDREVDAFLGFAPEPQELRARNIGQVILNTATDKPWSLYFCCMAYTRREFAHDYPVATKRVLRAILKAADLCAANPAGAAQRLVDEGFTDEYEYALQTLVDVPFDRWREYDPEDALRFFALRLHEVGMVGSSPNRIIADGADFRFLNELKRELKT